MPDETLREPTWVGRAERTDATEIAVDARFGAARLLVTMPDGAPLGQVTVPLRAGRAGAADVRAAIDARFGSATAPAAPSSVEPITVVVATRGRPDSIGRCVHSILGSDHPSVTVLVVDNDPEDELTRHAVEAIADERVRYVREARRGASAGRNRGLAEARTRLVAFTDDDTEVDPSWARRMAGAFAANPDLVCVSGPVLAASLGSDEERAADAALGWNKGFVSRTFSLADPPPDSAIFPFSPGLFGIGANLAVRADVARISGGFDEALGPGSATRSGEDCEFLVRLVLAGHVLGYEPSAYVWHHHRPDSAALREQVEGYAIGLAGFLTKVALSPRGRAAAFRRIPAAVRQLGRIADREAGAGDAMPSGAGRTRLRGMLAGPFVYLTARRKARRAGGRVPPLVAAQDQGCSDQDGPRGGQTRPAIALR
jgi:GT2 family glycosyltransferase